MNKKIDILEGVNEFFQRSKSLNESLYEDLPTEEINGVVYKVLDCSLNDFIKKTGAVRMEDVVWTKS